LFDDCSGNLEYLGWTEGRCGKLEGLGSTDDEKTCEVITDDETVRVVGGSVWPCVDITYIVSTVVKTSSFWQLRYPAKKVLQSIETFILR
jgi:hypothetical protein